MKALQPVGFFVFGLAMLGVSCMLVWAVSQAVKTGIVRSRSRFARNTEPVSFWMVVAMQSSAAALFGLVGLLALVAVGAMALGYATI